MLNVFISSSRLIIRSRAIEIANGAIKNRRIKEKVRIVIKITERTRRIKEEVIIRESSTIKIDGSSKRTNN